jgi:hypothetical protein
MMQILLNEQILRLFEKADQDLAELIDVATVASQTFDLRQKRPEI